MSVEVWEPPCEVRESSFGTLRGGLLFNRLHQGCPDVAPAKYNVEAEAGAIEVQIGSAAFRFLEITRY